MKILAFNFEKLSAERLSNTKDNIKVGTHVDISDISEVKAELLSPSGLILGVKFKFSLDYAPNFAKVEIAGHFLVEVDKSLGEKTLKEWKNKKLTDEIQYSLINVILEKSTLKALDLEEQIGIPLHFPMPSYKKE
ncbi:Uncharacterised protein [uncultured archaeon]|nr:Uncharacterised protein [uncultured archaeon]